MIEFGQHPKFGPYIVVDDGREIKVIWLGR